jgi:hypothetical protein
MVEIKLREFEFVKMFTRFHRRHEAKTEIDVVGTVDETSQTNHELIQ